jgi:hypothetical protein
MRLRVSCTSSERYDPRAVPIRSEGEELMHGSIADYAPLAALEGK